MPEIILFLCIFSITCGFMNIGNSKQNKKLIKIGFLGLLIWLAMFIWTPFAINYMK